MKTRWLVDGWMLREIIEGRCHAFPGDTVSLLGAARDAASQGKADLVDMTTGEPCSLVVLDDALRTLRNGGVRLR